MSVTDGYADFDTLIAAFKASGTAVACIASSDEIYEAEAATIAAALKAAGARQVWLAAGRRS